MVLPHLGYDKIAQPISNTYISVLKIVTFSGEPEPQFQINEFFCQERTIVMKPHKNFYQSILCVAILLCSAQLATAKRAISEKEFRTQVVGKSWKYKDPKGNTGRLKFYSSGAITVSFTPKGKKEFKDKGSWRWSGSQYCTKYRKIRKGKEKCYHLHKHGKGFIEPGTKGVMY